jgi:hypothetical protein
MDRSIARIGIAIIIAGFALVGFPIITTGQEQLDYEQVAGFLIAPLGLAVVLIAGISPDPRKTTVVGTFGNPEETPPAPPSGAPPGTRPRLRNPHAPVYCRRCRSVVTSDLARCPRCARARDCRSCGRPLGLVLERPTCPPCARAEAFCNCSFLVRPRGV